MIEIVHISGEYLNDITKLHIISLKNDFLPSMGFNFLKSLYKGILDKENIYGFVAKDNKKVIGFIIGCKDMADYLKVSLMSNFIELFFYLGLRILKKPQLLINVIETLSYSSKEKGPKAELVIIAIKKKYRGIGLGKKLIQILEKRFKEKKINEYKLTVHADKQAVYFYEKLGYYQFSQFKLYNKIWYVYTKKI